jgi:hypothetical protein
LGVKKRFLNSRKKKFIFGERKVLCEKKLDDPANV